MQSGSQQRQPIRLVSGGGQTTHQEPSSPHRSQRASDEDVVQALKAGERWAARALYDRVHVVIARTMRRILRNASLDYDDLTQITLERVFKTLAEDRFAGACSLTTWADAIAGHVALDALRAHMRRSRVLVPDEVEAVSEYRTVPLSPDMRLEARSEIRALQNVLSGMKPEQAETVVLHDVLGHELAEIAVVTGVTVAAAQSRLVRGRRQLHKRCETVLKRKHQGKPS